MVNEDKNIGDAVVDLETEQRSKPELNALVAEKLFGWSDLIYLPRPNYFAGFPPLNGNAKGFFVRTVVPSYSESIETAMKVVEKMRERGWSFACTLYEGHLPYASFCKQTAASSKNAEAETLPLAICRAALKATECLSISDRGTDGQASETTA